MNTLTTSPATDTPWIAEPSGDGFFQVVNNQSIIIAQRCVKEEAELFAAAPTLLARLKILLEDLRGAKELMLFGPYVGDSWMVTADGWDSLIESTEKDIAEAEGR
jgi:hypothetical protein